MSEQRTMNEKKDILKNKEEKEITNEEKKRIMK